jgi:diguanylate cyclase (GGDEF)-like protein
MEVAGSNLAQAVARQASDTIKQVDTAIIGLVERVEYDGVTQPAAVKRLHHMLVIAAAELPQIKDVSIFDAHGKRVMTSLRMPALSETEDYSNREFFSFHRTHDSSDPHIGPPILGRITGRWLIPVSRRINRPDGSFGGIVTATIDIEFFQHFYEGLQVGKHGAIAMLLEDSTVLVRRPLIEKYVGVKMGDTPLFREYKKQGPVGQFINVAPQDGVTRLISYRRLDHYPILAIVSLSKDEMLEGWWHDTLLHTGGVALLVAVVSLLGWRLVQRIQLHTRAEAELLQAHSNLTQLNQMLERLAMSDGLTGLANRRQFDDAMASEFSRAMRYGQALALVLLDVDCFKQYNDYYGHLAGDDCLQAICQTIQNVAAKRPGDVVARYGGEEIAVLLPQTDQAGAIAVAEKIRHAIIELNIPHCGNPAGLVTLSAGINVLDPVTSTDTIDAFINNADRALYSAKNNGRNRVECAEPKVRLHLA